MKKLIAVTVIIAFTLLALSVFAPAHAQDPAKEEKPTFYRLISGVYVNGWPRFTIHYPKDWVERPTNLLRGGVFQVSHPGPVDRPMLVVVIHTLPLPLEKFADLWVMTLRSSATDVTVVSDKASQLRDGSQGREVEIKMVRNGLPCGTLGLATKKGDAWIITIIESLNGKIGEDLRAILYSIEFQPEKDKVVKVPSDIQEFLDKFCSDMVSHDLAKVMTHYSDRYLNSGVRKGEMERFWRQVISSVTLSEIGITEFVTEGDRVYLAGFGATNLNKGYLNETSIIKENGEWKWFGNQRDVSP
jgi:hypothetical protein